MLVVFDLDGTLVDSRRDLADSTNEMLAGYGAAPLETDEVTGMVGEGAKVLVARAIAAAGVAAPVDEALNRFRAAYDRRLLVYTRPYPGIPEVLAYARQHASLAVLTNKPEAPSRRLLLGLGLAPAFTEVVGGDSGYPRKPDPAGLRHLMACTRHIPADTLLVGDSAIDVRTGNAAEVAVCGVRYGFGTTVDPDALAGARWIAANPGEIIAVLDRFLNRN